MKKIFLTSIISVFTSVAFCQYFEGTITNVGNQLVFSVRPKPGGGNIVISDGKQLSDIEFCVRYPDNSAPFSWGTFVTGPTFPGAIFKFKGNNEFGTYPNKTIARFQWLTDGTVFVPNTVTSSAATNVTYTDGVTYEVFRVGVIGPVATVDFELVYNDTFVPAYIAISDKSNNALDVTSVGSGNAFFGTGFNVSGSDQIVPLSNVPVPVKFLDFAATKKNNTAVLSWRVENEDATTAKYVIQKSANAVNFDDIAELPARNNGSNVYNFTQNNLSAIHNSGVIYFRIKQSDKDGKFVYTPIRSVRLDGKSFSISSYPNPVKDFTKVIIDLTKESNVNVTVTDASGKLVRNINIQGVKGLNFKDINMSNLASGSYMLKVQTDKEIKTISLIKSN